MNCMRYNQDCPWRGEVDLGKPFRRLTMNDTKSKEYAGVDFLIQLRQMKRLRHSAKERMNSRAIHTRGDIHPIFFFEEIL